MHGEQTMLSECEEIRLAELITLVGVWEYPLEKIDIRYMVKGYLDRKGKKVIKFNKNLPGIDWVNLFYSGHKEFLPRHFVKVSNVLVQPYRQKK